MKIFLTVFFIFNCWSVSCASAAERFFPVYNMPKLILERLKQETTKYQRGECEEKRRELFISQFYELPGDKLLVLIGLPDYFCYSGSFMPITVDKQGHWKAGDVIGSLPSELLKDAAQAFWLISHWEIEAVFPLLHYSMDGIHWQELTLPKPETIECCFQYLKQVCLTDSQIQLKLSGLDDTPVEYWQTTVSDSLTSAPHWQKLTVQQLKKDRYCQTVPVSSGDWQKKVTADGNGIRFQSEAHRMTIIIPRWLK